MGIRVIVKHPDPILKEKCVLVRKINDNVRRLLDDMAATMYDAEGVGLAAPQIGIPKRIAIVDVGDENGKIELINPEIVTKEGEQLGPEGCLSIPGLLGDVNRYETICVQAQNRNGESFEITATGFLARAIQHEIDHLNGVLFLDIAQRVYTPQEDGHTSSKNGDED